MTQLILFAAIFLISKELSKYTLLSNYELFNTLPAKLQSFKLFTCKPCNIFWISFIIGLINSIFITYNYTAYALLAYLFAKIDDLWDYINNRN